MANWKRLTPYGRVKMVRNVLDMYDQSTEGEREYGEAWYRVAHDAAQRIGRAHGMTPTRTVAAVIAALSPSNKWQSNLVDAERYVAARVNGESMPTARTYGRHQAKAWEILHAGGDPLRFFGPTAPKTRAFFLSIAEPNENHGTVVVDGHTYNIACGIYTLLADVPSLTTLGRYLPVAEAFCASAVIAGITPQAMQATCWLTHRRLHLDVRADDFHPLITTPRIT